MVTGTLLVTAEGSGGEPRLHAVDKQTGERLATIDLPAVGQYGMMTYMHEGDQYIVVQTGGRTPGSSPELCVKVRGSSSMLLLGCLGDLLRFEKREIQVATFAPDRSSP